MQSLGSRFCAETEGNLKGSFAQLKLFFISAFSGSAHIYDKFLANILFNMIRYIFFKQDATFSQALLWLTYV